MLKITGFKYFPVDKINFIYAAAILCAFFMAIAAPCPCNACDLTLYNFVNLFENISVKEVSYFNAFSDSIGKFCTQTAPMMYQTYRNILKQTDEIKLIIDTPVLFISSTMTLENEIKKIIADSIEAELKITYKTNNVKICDSAELNLIFKEFSKTSTGEIKSVSNLTAEQVKKLYFEHKIYAILSVAVDDIKTYYNIAYNINKSVEDRRDATINYNSNVDISYKITQCYDNEIIWIDKIGGHFEDIYYYSFFENAVPFYLKKECTKYSVIGSSSCTN
ncbi:MAG: hypothetical protein QMC67_16835 [Candidatus Wallbacteria bacterium]